MTAFRTARVEITSFHPGRFGGGVAIGREHGREVRALVRAAVLPREPREGETWRFAGPPETVTVPDRRTGGHARLEHIAAQVALPLEPSGAGIRRWIARSRDIPGVGEAYAGRLWDRLGPSLYAHLRARDAAPIASVLDVPKAHAIIDAWALLADEVTALERLDRLGVSGATANAALRLFGARAADRFEADPYAVTLVEPWRQADASALAAGIRPDDPRRLAAAVDVAASMVFRTTESNLGGHTAMTRDMLRRRVRQLLGSGAARLADHAIDAALGTGALLPAADGLLQARAPWHMEREIEADLADRLAAPRPPLPVGLLRDAVAEAERGQGFALGPEQASAVRMALACGFSSIWGGAGTGKSTVCRAILNAAARLHPPRRRHVRGTGMQEEVTCCMVAVSGRAAKVLRDATGGTAMTVHRFLAAREAGRLWFERGLLVVDEASMVGTPDLWRVLAATPRAAGVVLVGDVAQLPPVRAGHPARAISEAELVPSVTLATAHRQREATGIPAFSAAVRAGTPPVPAAFDLSGQPRPCVSMVSCAPDRTAGAVLEVFGRLAGPPVPSGDTAALERLHGADVQILCMTKPGPAGARELGDAVERRWLAAWPPLHGWGLRVGSKVLWTRNSYGRPVAGDACGGRDPEGTVDLMNGTLGTVRRPAPDGGRGAMAAFDGIDGEVAIGDPDLEMLVRGWAMTVHKAQGSAFRHVVLPLVRSRLLDRAMLYTALTRARESVVIVGDPGLFEAAVRAEPRAWLRLQALDPDAAIRRRGAPPRKSGAPRAPP